MAGELPRMVDRENIYTVSFTTICQILSIK